MGRRRKPGIVRREWRGLQWSDDFPYWFRTAGRAVGVRGRVGCGWGWG